MEIRRHPECTRDIGAPADMTDEQCSPLPVLEFQDEDGIWSCSFWKPNEAELAGLVAGGSIVLKVRASGRQHPVVAMAVTPDATEPL